jgi:DNA invertase Pin-like site-specific DNA recombinase
MGKKPEQPKGELIGYARVSTREQNLDLQLAALKAVGCLEIHEEHVSATSQKRPALDLAIKNLRPGDTLVVWRLDRLARNMRELYARLDQIAEMEGGFRSLTESFDFTTATGQLILGFMGLMAQFERQLTIERTKAGLEAAVARGVDLGAPRKFTEKKRAEARKLLKQGKMTKKAIAKRLGISDTRLYSFIRDGMK